MVAVIAEAHFSEQESAAKARFAYCRGVDFKWDKPTDNRAGLRGLTGILHLPGNGIGLDRTRIDKRSQ